MGEYYEQRYPESDVTISNEELSNMNFDLSSMKFYSIIVDQLKEVDNIPKNIYYI